MSTDHANSLRAFLHFADAQLAGGQPDLALDEILRLWERANLSETEREETLQAIQRGLDDMHAGRTVDAFESLGRLRNRVDSIGKP